MAKNQRRKGGHFARTTSHPLNTNNITPTFILEVKLRVSTSHTHNVFFPTYSAFFFLFAAARTSFHFLCLALALTRTHLLSCHALLVFFYSVFSEKSSRMDRLSRNPLSQDLLFFAPVRPCSLLVTKRSLSSAARHVKQPRCTRRSENPSDWTNRTWRVRRSPNISPSCASGISEIFM